MVVNPDCDCRRGGLTSWRENHAVHGDGPLPFFPFLHACSACMARIVSWNLPTFFVTVEIICFVSLDRPKPDRRPVTSWCRDARSVVQLEHHRARRRVELALKVDESNVLRIDDAVEPRDPWAWPDDKVTVPCDHQHKISTLIHVNTERTTPCST